MLRRVVGSSHRWVEVSSRSAIPPSRIQVLYQILLVSPLRWGCGRRLRRQIAPEKAVDRRTDLIEKGLGYTYGGLDRGIDSHIKNLRRKIEPDPVNPIYIQAVYGVGYRLGA